MSTSHPYPTPKRPHIEWLFMSSDKLPPILGDLNKHDRWVFYMNGRSTGRVVCYHGKFVVWIARMGVSASGVKIPTYGDWDNHLTADPTTFDNVEEAKAYVETVCRLEGA